MKHYLVTGPESLLKAAFEECKNSKIFIESSYPIIGDKANYLVVAEYGNYWLCDSYSGLYKKHLALPGDWDKFIGILTDLKNPKLPTTSQGIPYLRQGQQVFYGTSGNDGVLTVGNLRHLLRQGVTEIVTKAGRLTQADLELLTK